MDICAWLLGDTQAESLGKKSWPVGVRKVAFDHWTEGIGSKHPSTSAWGDIGDAYKTGGQLGSLLLTSTLPPSQCQVRQGLALFSITLASLDKPWPPVPLALLLCPASAQTRLRPPCESWQLVILALLGPLLAPLFLIIRVILPHLFDPV